MKYIVANFSLFETRKIWLGSFFRLKTHTRARYKCGSRAVTACKIAKICHFFGKLSDWTYLKISSAASPYQECIARERDCLLIANVRDATCEKYQMKYLRYRASLHATAIRQASASLFEPNIFISSLLVIGRYDKLSSRSSARSSYLRAISRSAKKGRKKEREREKKKEKLRTDILLSLEKCWMRRIAVSDIETTICVSEEYIKMNSEIKWNNWNICVSVGRNF